MEEQNRWDQEDIGDKIKEEFDGIGKEFLDDYEVDDMDREITSITKHGFTWGKLQKLFIAFRWVINIVIIGFPWLLWSFLLVVYNIVFNAWLNKWWAKGNVWLLFNTYFAIAQAVLSWPLFFEVGIYLRHFYVFRWLSLLNAIIYNTVYLGLLAGWLIQTYTLPEETMEEVGTMDILLNMFFMYNTIMHCSIVPINAGIILKEIEMEFYEIAHGAKESDYNLSFKEAESDFGEKMWFLNPILVFDRLFYAFFKWHPKDIFVYNVQDDDKFISNWGK